MKIGFDAKRLFLNHSGLGNYSRNLLLNLAKFYPGNEYHLFTPETGNAFPQFTQAPFKNSLPQGFLDNLLKSRWRSRTIINQIQSQNPHVFHGLSNELPYTISRFKGKKIVTIHDLIFIRFPHLYGSFDRANYRKKVLSACKKADAIIAISQQTKNDLIEFLQIDEKKIKVVYQSCDDVFWETKTDNSIFSIGKVPADYVLYVGTVEPRKNLLKLVEAIKNIDLPLVVVGRIKSAYGKSIMDFISKNALGKKVIFLQNVSNNQLVSLYSKAICMVYPSSFEGFGLPVLEAMVCGCPVITGNNSSLTEAGGDAALYLNVENTEEYVNNIQKVAGSTVNRTALITSGLENSKRFSPSVWAQNTIEIYK